MNTKIKICLLFLIAILSIGFAACGSNVNTNDPNEKLYAIDIKEAPIRANPQKAIDAIYDNTDYIAEEFTEHHFQKATNIDLSNVIEVYGKLSDAKGVLADIIIVKPLPGARDDVRDQLYMYKEHRIDEFENYDILDAHSIARDAIVYDQGEYVILLMLQDNTLAQTTVDQYIPQ